MREERGETARVMAPLTRQILALAVGTTLITAGWWGAGSASRAESQDTSVTIKTFRFGPTPLPAKAGARVIWTNTDDITHTVTSGTPENRDGRFNSPLAGKGATFSFTFTQPGAYPYFCDRHPSMRGEVRVD